MIPVALAKGDGAETRVPMAVAIIGGLVSSTVLTLGVVPIVYSLLDGLRQRVMPHRPHAHEHDEMADAGVGPGHSSPPASGSMAHKAGHAGGTISAREAE
jgi:HAE1 family hydrophobic/amphiphilic exporter-1